VGRGQGICRRGQRLLAVSWRGGLAAALALALAGTAEARPADSRARYGAHSMLYLDSPYALKAAMFREAARMGAGWIRLDVAVPAIVQSPDQRNWRQLDQYVHLARRYRLHVSAVLLGTPWWIARCAPGTPLPDTFRCPAGDPGQWAAYAAEIAAHAAGAIDTWEVWNEPDSRANFTGTPRDYAAMLSAADTAIKRVRPQATVLDGGVRSLRSRAWLSGVLAASGPAFDVANVHVRGHADRLRGDVAAWKRFFRGRGFRGPVWVTEHGYPSQTRYQYDAHYRGGTCAQAAYLAHSVPALLRGGAAKVFVTERNNLHGKYASEGVLGGRIAAVEVRPKPAAAIFGGRVRSRGCRAVRTNLHRAKHR
jgi:hypothetical protein